MPKLWVEGELYRKMEKRAKELGISVSEYATKLTETMKKTN